MKHKVHFNLFRNKAMEIAEKIVKWFSVEDNKLD